MNNKTNKIIYLGATGLLTALMLMSAGMYVFDHQTISQSFTTLGYPTYLIYPLVIAKVLGLIAIWTKKSQILKEWAYAGFFFDILLALFAHISVGDGEFAPALIAMVFVLTSYIFHKRVELTN